MIIANHLGHRLIVAKREADACEFDDPTIQYEYLSCKEGGSGQFDRMFSTPSEKRATSLQRIARNSKIYLAIFYKNDQLKVKIIYAIEPEIMKQEAERQLDKSSNAISHIAFNETWARENGRVVYEDR